MTDSQPDFRGAFTTGGAAVIPDHRVENDLLEGAASLFERLAHGSAVLTADAAAAWLDVYRATLGRSVPVDVDRFDGPEHALRTDHQVLIGIGQLLEEQLAELKHLRAALSEASASSRSSVQLEQDSKGTVKITVKTYDGSSVGPVGDEAIAEFGRLFCEVERQQRQQWQDTLDAKREAAG